MKEGCCDKCGKLTSRLIDYTFYYPRADEYITVDLNRCEECDEDL